MTNKILDPSYYDLIIDNTMVAEYDTGDNITNLNERHSLLHVRTNNNDMCNLGLYPYHRFPSIFTLNSIVSHDASGITSVQRNPYLSLYGQGVLIALIDTGICYQHEAFCYSDHSSRIVSIWDQTIEDGNAPEGFSYGSEYTKDMINLALKSVNPLEIVPSTDEDGHGSALASVAAGSIKTEKGFAGVAPESELVIVKLKSAKKILKDLYSIPEDRLCFQESDVMLGLNYVFQVAKKLNRPIAVCLGLGTSQGGHDDSGATSNYISYLSQISKVGISVASGMEANKRRHYFREVKGESFSHDFEVSIDGKDKMLSMEIWPFVPARLTVELITPTGESTKCVYPEISGCRQFGFVFNQSRVWINNIIMEEETGDQMILLRFQDPTPGIWKIRVKNLQKELFAFHAWLPSGNLISQDTVFVESNPDTTVTSPGNAVRSLTVAAYNEVENSILADSGRGFSRRRTENPDIAAPGYRLPCALSTLGYGSVTGTGAATAHATGIMAMILEWAAVKGFYTTITGHDINRLIVRGAQRNPSLEYPNVIWGYGKINVNQLFENLSIF